MSDIINEQPQQVAPFNNEHNLNNYDTQQKIKSYVENNSFTKILNINEVDILLRRNTNEDIYVGMTDGIVVYYSSIKEFQKEKYSQSILMSIGKGKGIPRKMILDHLIDNYGALYSDSQQTHDGETFWKKLLKLAVDSGFKVGYIDNRNKEEYNSSSNLEDWIASKNAWGDTNEYKEKRFVIYK